MKNFSLSRVERESQETSSSKADAEALPVILAWSYQVQISNPGVSLSFCLLGSVLPNSSDLSSPGFTGMVSALCLSGEIWQLCCVMEDVPGVIWLLGLGDSPTAAVSLPPSQTHLTLHFPTESKIFFLADVLAGKTPPLLDCALTVSTLQVHNCVYMHVP